MPAVHEPRLERTPEEWGHVPASEWRAEVIRRMERIEDHRHGQHPTWVQLIPVIAGIIGLVWAVA